MIIKHVLFKIESNPIIGDSEENRDGGFPSHTDLTLVIKRNIWILHGFITSPKYDLLIYS